MPWVKLDDQFIYHPKAILAGKDGRMLYLTALCYCANQLTDGLVQPAILTMLGGMAEVDDLAATVARLIDVGLFEQEGDGYRISERRLWEFRPDKTTQEMRNCREYERWRLQVLERDHYVCQTCKTSRDEMHVHHIRAWAAYPDLRFSVDNGVTLCRDCHMALHGLMPAEETE